MAPPHFDFDATKCVRYSITPQHAAKGQLWLSGAASVDQAATERVSRAFGVNMPARYRRYCEGSDVKDTPVHLFTRGRC
jgi:hypothetical protein